MEIVAILRQLHLPRHQMFRLPIRLHSSNSSKNDEEQALDSSHHLPRLLQKSATLGKMPMYNLHFTATRFAFMAFTLFHQERQSEIGHRLQWRQNHVGRKGLLKIVSFPKWLSILPIMSITSTSSRSFNGASQCQVNSTDVVSFSALNHHGQLRILSE